MSKKTKPETETSEPKTWVCYWQSDASPIPQIKVEQKAVSKADAEAWLMSVSAGGHWTPKIRDRATLKA